MKLTQAELEFLSAWAREEQEPACYQLPAHRQQLDHGVSGAHLLVLIKAWVGAEGKKDLDILGAASNPQPRWPWSTAEFAARFAEANLRTAADSFRQGWKEARAGEARPIAELWEG